MLSTVTEWFTAWYRFFSGTLRIGRMLKASASYAKNPKPLHHLWLETVQRHPHKKAWVNAATNTSITFQDANLLMNRIAAWATATHNVARGVCVGLMMESRAEFVCTWMGIGKTGGSTALVNTQLRGDALLHAIRVSGSKLLIVGVECAEAILEIADQLPAGTKFALYSANAGVSASAGATVPSSWERLDDVLPTCSTSEPGPIHGFTHRDPIVMIYTSGTTGMPKAARVTHQRFSNTLHTHVMLDFNPDDVIYICLPLYHSSGGVMAMGYTLKIGCTMVVRPKFSARMFWSDCTKHGATCFQYIGELCRYLLNTPAGEHDTAHKIRIAIGNGLRPDVWKPFQSRFGIPQIMEFYASTEGNIGMMNYFNEPHAMGYYPTLPFPFRWFSLSRARFYPVQFVRYDRETEMPMRDAVTGRCVQADWNEPAEVLGMLTAGKDLLGTKNFGGYVNDEDGSNKKILRNVLKEGDMYFRSGDLVRMDKRGFIYFEDRIGDTFRWKGENVATTEVANAFGKVPCVAEANVYGVLVPHADGRAGMASVVLRDNNNNTFDGQSAYSVLSHELPAYARPVFIRVQHAMDTTGTFKHKKSDLQKEGFTCCGDDDVYVADHTAKTYVVLTDKHISMIEEGNMKL